LISRKKADGIRAIQSGKEATLAAIPAIRALMASRTPAHAGQELSEQPPTTVMPVADSNNTAQ
jgi:hypothetical protein